MLTDKAIEKLASDAKKQKVVKQKSDDDEKRGNGRLIIRAQPSGNVHFWYRYRQASKWAFLELGAYDRNGQIGLSLGDARRKLQELIAKRAAAHEGDLKAHIQLEQETQQLEEKRQSQEKEHEARQAKEGTLQKLLQTYIEHLEKQGKESARDVRNLFRKHVFTAWPQLSDKKAGDVTVAEITEVLRKMVNNGIGRNTAKLRSYIRAAYALAMQAANDPTVAATAQIFNLTNNPAASIPALSQFNKAGNRVLDSTELGHYIRRVEGWESPVTRSLLLIALYLGGQRPTQLARLCREHLDLNASTVMLLDPKGNRRAGPRQHILPVSVEVKAMFAPLLEMNNESDLIFTTNGKVAINTETASSAVGGICKAMIAAGEARSTFSMRDIRRTCETMAAAMGVSMDVRAQIQSHGLSGVQNRHYDRHQYMDEKRAALDQWVKKLISINKAMQASLQADYRMAA